MNHRLDVAYRHSKTTGNPLFVSNDVIQRLALEARRQIGRGETPRTATDDLLSISEIQANGIRYEVSWCIDAPVSNEQGVPVLGLCEYDPEGLPNTALIFANPEAIEQNDTLLISTLAHELGHGIFEAPGWIVASRSDPLPGLLEPANRRMFRTVTPDEEHLASKENGPKGKPNFVEWRANEFMGSFLVPREMLTVAVRDCAETIKVPLEDGSPASSLVPAADQGGVRIASTLGARERAFKIPVLINALADVFGVSRRFIEVRLLRYGLIEEALLNGA
jgi:hypothetical protein